MFMMNLSHKKQDDDGMEARRSSPTLTDYSPDLKVNLLFAETTKYDWIRLNPDKSLE
jgi:hypothetical protein